MNYGARDLPEFTKAIEDAKSAGFTIYQSTLDRILLDLDSPQALNTFIQNFDKAYELFGVRELERWPSKTKDAGHWHVILACDPLPYPTRSIIALSLGSDPLREMLAIDSYNTHGITEPSLLFRPAIRPEEVKV